MAERKEQVKPLAPAAYRIDYIKNEDEALSMELKKYRHKKYIKCCGCIAALCLIQVVIILVLIFTVFHIKNPKMRINSIRFEGLSNLSNRSANVTLIASVSIKNPNVASFKFSNATTTVYYHGEMVGEARSPAGHVKARRTLRTNVTVDIEIKKMKAIPGLTSDLSDETLEMSAYSRISGRVKITSLIKKDAVVKMNCTMTVNVRNQQIQDQRCRPHVSI
ncbi:uncharacterized protein LOC132285363 [Cornus florida]|uniref:uncharacterized protein LOC132285363 n=1 Tax=Cornus florida TaxID=4283 RepID=UPI00289FF8E8|nr:uncharacterized protein LOC132285363 [Cornus florida]